MLIKLVNETEAPTSAVFAGGSGQTGSFVVIETDHKNIMFILTLASFAAFISAPFTGAGLTNQIDRD